MRFPTYALSLKPLLSSGCFMCHQFSIQQFSVLPTHCIYVFCVDPRTNSDYFPPYNINCLLFAVLWATCSVCAPVLVPLIACRWQCSCPRVAIKSYVALHCSPSDGWKDLLYTAMENRANRILGAAFVWRQSSHWLAVTCSLYLCSSPCRRSQYVSMLHSITWHCHCLHIHTASLPQQIL
jgi:hypothetical protein